MTSTQEKANNVNSIIDIVKQSETKDRKLYPVRLHPTFRNALSEKLEEVAKANEKITGTYVKPEERKWMETIIQKEIIKLNPDYFERNYFERIRSTEKAPPPHENQTDSLPD